MTHAEFVAYMNSLDPSVVKFSDAKRETVRLIRALKAKHGVANKLVKMWWTPPAHWKLDFDK